VKTEFSLPSVDPPWSGCVEYVSIALCRHFHLSPLLSPAYGDAKPEAHGLCAAGLGPLGLVKNAGLELV
jgi:hypothetical protein